MEDLEPLILSDEEIAQLTRKKRRAQQIICLRELGITYGMRPDGSLVVSRRHTEFVLGGILDRMCIGYPEPDFDSLN